MRVGVLADKVGRSNTAIIPGFRANMHDAGTIGCLTGPCIGTGGAGSLPISFNLYRSCEDGHNAPMTIAEVFGVQRYAAVNGVIYFVGKPERSSRITKVILGSHARSARSLGYVNSQGV